jgi:NTP pyrophosphatase (non-canonical NTP hydrolase)
VARQVVQWFGEEMEKKLKENDHKASWTDCDMDYLMSRTEQELDELSKAIVDLKFGIGTIEDVIKEAADVANFVMMIADNSRENSSTDRGK